MNSQNRSGLLDDTWDCAIPIENSNNQSTNEFSLFQTSIEEVIRDKSILHSLCQESFRLHTNLDGSIGTQESLGTAVNWILIKCQLEELDEEDVKDIWVSVLNFSEFYTLVLELLTAIHRAIYTDYT